MTGTGTSTPVRTAELKHTSTTTASPISLLKTTTNSGTNTLTYDSVNQSQRTSISTVNGSTTTTQKFGNTAIGVTGILTNGTRSAYIRDPSGHLIGQTTGTGESLDAVTDYQGSTIALVDSNQAIAAGYSYTPTGNPTSSYGRAANTNPFLWIGAYQNNDLDKTYNLGYRQYDTRLARFTQPDPSGQDSNPYAYAVGNPISFADPSGLGISECLGEVLPIPPANGETLAEGGILAIGGAGAIVTGTIEVAGAAALAVTGPVAIGVALAGGFLFALGGGKILKACT